MVTVRLPTILRKYADDAESIDVPAESVEDALRQVAAMHADLAPRLFTDDRLSAHLLVFHADKLIKPERISEAPFDAAEPIDLLVPISGGSDVRMKGFRHRVTVEEALAAALSGVDPLDPEALAVTEAAGRVLAEAVVSEVDVPPFRRSGMDGFAVVAEDTFGATSYDPIELPVVGTSMPGVGPNAELRAGTALRIMTGAPVPDGADAVLRAEDATERDGIAEVRAPVAVGKNVGRVGDDIARGTTVLKAGRRLLPQDVGVLSSIGCSPVVVHRRPKVRIVVSGDELLPPGSRPDGVKIVDSNSVMLSALVVRDGGEPTVVRVPDDEGALRSALAEPGADVILTSGAASVGTEDRVPLLIGELGELTIHGVSMRPSSPSGVGRIGQSKVLILPGNPVSSLVSYDFFAGPVIRRLGGRDIAWPYDVVSLPLDGRLVSKIGRTDYARVGIVDGAVRPIAISGASVLSSVTRADGFVIIPAALEGYPEGATVDVGLYATGLG